MKKFYLFFAAMFSVGALIAQTPIITTYAGSTQGYSGDGGPATTAQLYGNAGIAIDASGNMYIADQSNYVVRKISTTGTISTILGGVGLTLGDGGPATAAIVSKPSAVTVDATGNIYVSDLANRIRKIDASTNIITTYVGNGTAGSIGDGGMANAAEINQPGGIAFDGSGNFYVCEVIGHKVRKVTSSGMISTFAGTGTTGNTGDGGPAASALLAAPTGVIADAAGNIYISDAFNGTIRVVSATTGNISIYAGGGSPGAGEGVPATSAYLSQPSGMAFDAAGNLYVAEGAHNKVRVINKTTSLITTVCGDGTAALLGDNGPATAAELNQPAAVAFNSAGKLFVSDNANNRIRRISTGPAITGSSSNICTTKTATLSCATTGGTWTSGTTTVATIGSSTGIVTGVAAGTATITYKTTSDLSFTTVTVTVCKVAVNNVNAPEQGLAVYPNPSYGTFNMTLTEPYDENMSVTVTDIVGVKVKELTMESNKTGNISLNAPAGIYFINVVTPHGRWSEKVTKLQ